MIVKIQRFLYESYMENSLSPAFQKMSNFRFNRKYNNKEIYILRFGRENISFFSWWSLFIKCCRSSWNHTAWTDCSVTIWWIILGCTWFRGACNGCKINCDNNLVDLLSRLIIDTMDEMENRCSFTKWDFIFLHEFAWIFYVKLHIYFIKYKNMVVGRAAEIMTT